MPNLIDRTEKNGNLLSFIHLYTYDTAATDVNTGDLMSDVHEQSKK